MKFSGCLFRIAALGIGLVEVSAVGLAPRRRLISAVSLVTLSALSVANGDDVTDPSTQNSDVLLKEAPSELSTAPPGNQLDLVSDHPSLF